MRQLITNLVLGFLETAAYKIENGRLKTVALLIIDTAKEYLPLLFDNKSDKISAEDALKDLAEKLKKVLGLIE